MCLQDFPRLACLFDPEFTPPLRTDLTIDERAGVRLLEERAIAALLIALWCVLIFDRLLSHLAEASVTRPSKIAAPAAPATLRVTIVRWKAPSAELRSCPCPPPLLQFHRFCYETNLNKPQQKSHRLRSGQANKNYFRVLT